MKKKVTPGLIALVQIPAGASGVPTFRCPHCGATQIFDPAIRALICPFCATPVVMAARATAPNDLRVSQRVAIPFVVNQAQSMALLRLWLGSSLLVPKDLGSRAALDGGRGVYIPFFLFECAVRSDWSGAYAETRYRTESYTDADGRTQQQQVSYTVWIPQNGCHRAQQHTLISASTGLTQAEADALLPFALSDAERDAPAYFAGFAAEQPQTAGDTAWSTGEGRIRAMERHACSQLTQRLISVDTTIRERVTSLVWLPVWIYSYAYRGTDFRVVVNGQTGEVRGQRPLSTIKVASAIASLSAMVALLILTIVLKMH